jgi:predicted DNA-binding transcriptional regulator
MAWIEINSNLQFYSLADDLMMVLEWLWVFVTKMSPIYYTFLIMALFVFMLVMLLYRLDMFKGIGDR